MLLSLLSDPNTDFDTKHGFCTREIFTKRIHVPELTHKAYEQGLLKVLSYRAFHELGQAKLAYGGSILGSCQQFTILL